MSIPALNLATRSRSIAPPEFDATPFAPLQAQPVDGPSFADVLKDVINDTSRLQQESKNAIEGFVRGDGVPLHQVMAANEEAAIALEFLVELKNQATEAIRQVSQM